MLADFIAEWTEVQMPSMVVDQEYWTMYFDGLLMKKGTGVGLVFVSPLRVCIGYMEALFNGLRIAIELGIRCLNI